MGVKIDNPRFALVFKKGVDVDGKDVVIFDMSHEYEVIHGGADLVIIYKWTKHNKQRLYLFSKSDIKYIRHLDLPDQDDTDKPKVIVDVLPDENDQDVIKDSDSISIKTK